MLETVISLALCLPAAAGGVTAGNEGLPPDSVLVRVPLRRVIERKIDTEVSTRGADVSYDKLKAELDARFERMFALKAELEKSSFENEKKWNEYYKLNEEYNKRLKRLIADWATAMQMGEDKTADDEFLYPMPRTPMPIEK